MWVVLAPVTSYTAARFVLVTPLCCQVSAPCFIFVSPDNENFCWSTSRSSIDYSTLSTEEIHSVHLGKHGSEHPAPADSCFTIIAKNPARCFVFQVRSSRLDCALHGAGAHSNVRFVLCLW